MSTERKEFESWVARVRLPYCDTPADRAQQWIGWQGCRAFPAAAVPEGALPPLPRPDHSLDCGMQPFYRPDQMQAYARAAVEADRAQADTLQNFKDAARYRILRNAKKIPASVWHALETGENVDQEVDFLIALNESIPMCDPCQEGRYVECMHAIPCVLEGATKEQT